MAPKLPVFGQLPHQLPHLGRKMPHSGGPERGNRYLVGVGAEGGTRTLKPFRARDFESRASASSATSASVRVPRHLL